MRAGKINSPTAIQRSWLVGLGVYRSHQVRPSHSQTTIGCRSALLRIEDSTPQWNRRPQAGQPNSSINASAVNVPRRQAGHRPGGRVPRSARMCWFIATRTLPVAPV